MTDDLPTRVTADGTSDLTDPGSVPPTPIIPDPTAPAPTDPTPIPPEPMIPDPTTPEPVEPEPVPLSPIVPDPGGPEPVPPTPINPDPTVRRPANPLSPTLSGDFSIHQVRRAGRNPAVVVSTK